MPIVHISREAFRSSSNIVSEEFSGFSDSLLCFPAEGRWIKQIKDGEFSFLGPTFTEEPEKRVAYNHLNEPMPKGSHQKVTCPNCIKKLKELGF